MNQFTFANHWDEIKGQLRQRYAQLTDDDVAFVAGKGEELLARLREKLGLSAHDLNNLLEELSSKSSAQFEKIKARVSDIADTVKSKGAAAAVEVQAQAEEAYAEARQRVRTLREDGLEYVRQNPREALGVALCAGFVAGLLIRR